METSTNTPSTYRRTRFRFVEISPGFVDETFVLLERGDPVVFLGPRGIGKQLVLAQIQEKMRATGCITVRLHCESCVDWSPEKFLKHIWAAIANEVAGLDRDGGPIASSWTEAVRKLLLSDSRRIAFLVSNLDSLPTAIARNLLRSFRELSMLGGPNTGRFSVLMTGAFDLAPLVHGADSEFHVSDQFVFQGQCESEFIEFFRQYVGASGLTLADRCGEYLFSKVGGHLLLLRIVMESLMDNRRTNRQRITDPVTPTELESVVADVVNRRSVFGDVLIKVFSRLDSSQRSLEMIRDLIQRNHCELPSKQSSEDASLALDPPTELELCGVAKRESGRLIWASELMKTLSKQHFTLWTLGDSFACGHDWTLAFRCYRRALNGQTYAEFSVPHRPRIQAAQRGFDAGLFRIAGESSSPITKLRKFFAGGARVLFGFDEVTYWQFNDEMQVWSLVDISPGDRLRQSARDVESTRSSRSVLAPIKKSVAQHLNALLPRWPTEGINDINEKTYAPFVVLAKLPEFERSQRECVVLSNFDTETPLTIERRKAAEDVIGVFGEAYVQAHRNQQRERRVTLQQDLLKALSNVFRLLEGHPEKTRQALEAAGNVLRAKRYRRVMFSLVDQFERRIKGVVDCHEAHLADIFNLSVWSLNVRYGLDGKPLFEDVQQECVLTGDSLAIADARFHPRTCKKIVDVASHTAVLLVPLKHGGRVLGTMHVERSDGSLPDRDEIRTLELFASQLAEAINATTWMDLLEEALHEQLDTLVIVDHQEQIRFANRAASEQLGLSLGWQHDAIKAKGKLDGETLEAFRQARDHNSNFSRFLTDRGDPSSLRVADVRPITDWNKSVTSYVIRVINLDRLARLLDALRKIAACRDAESLATEYLSGIQVMGHKWGRLYRLDSKSGRLVGYKQFGFDEDSEGAKHFAAGTATLPSRNESAASWLCLEDARPIVLSMFSARLPRESYTNSQGLSVINVSDPGCPSFITRKDGDVWIDLPFLSREKTVQPIGKVSVECPSTLTPEEFKQLQILTEAASAGFASIEARAAREVEEEALRRREMLRVIGETSHQLQSKLASLTTLMELFPTPNCDEVAQLNRQFSERLAETQGVLDSVKGRLKPLQCQKRRSCLVSFLGKVFGTQLAPSAFRVHCDSSEFLADFDDRLLREGIEELILNSKKAAGHKHTMQMSAAIRPLFIRGVPWCRLEVRDNGPGIPQVKLGRIFDEFFSEWLSAGVRGTGLGLSFVKSIVDAHGGTVEARESNSGACFRIELPRYDTSDSSDAPKNDVRCETWTL